MNLPESSLLAVGADETTPDDDEAMQSTQGRTDVPPSAEEPFSTTSRGEFITGILHFAPLSPQFAEQIQLLEALLGKRVCVFCTPMINDFIHDIMFDRRWALPKDEPIALLIDSPGGDARSAYRIARLLKTHCSGYTAVVPRYAKSAATLLSLGADQILLGQYGELGPLDAQLMDADREEYASALDEVQAFERLNAFALQSVLQTMEALLQVSGKRIDVLLPYVLHFVADMMRPLVEDIDAVRTTQRSRALRVGEEYAVRLLADRYSQTEAESIVNSLVQAYPEHGFVIDRSEAEEIGLRLPSLSQSVSQLLDLMVPHLRNLTAIGCVVETGQGEDGEGQEGEETANS